MLFSSTIDLNIPAFGGQAPKRSLLATIDPRIALISILTILAIISVTINPYVYLLLTALIAMGLIASRINPALFFSGLRPFILLAMITFILHLIFGPKAGSQIINVFGIHITDQSLMRGGIFVWRILLFFSVTLIFIGSLDPLDIADSLVRILRPLRRLRLNVDHLGLMFFLSFRFIPILQEEWQMIYAAMVSRGFEPGRGFIHRLRNMLPLLLAVFAAAFRRADNMALALTARGFDPKRERSSYRQFKTHARDWIFLSVLTVFGVGAVLLDIYA